MIALIAIASSGLITFALLEWFARRPRKPTLVDRIGRYTL